MSTTPSSYMAIPSLSATPDDLLSEEGRTPGRHKGPTARGFLPSETRPPRTGPTHCGNELAQVRGCSSSRLSQSPHEATWKAPCMRVGVVWPIHLTGVARHGECSLCCAAHTRASQGPASPQAPTGLSPPTRNGHRGTPTPLGALASLRTALDRPEHGNGNQPAPAQRNVTHRPHHCSCRRPTTDSYTGPQGPGLRRPKCAVNHAPSPAADRTGA